jgi:hypothetical protein
MDTTAAALDELLKILSESPTLAMDLTAKITILRAKFLLQTDQVVWADQKKE